MSGQAIPSLGPEAGTVVHPEPARIDGTIYIVDDEEDSRSLLALVLRPTGLRIETFGSAEELLEIAAFASHGCIVLDLLLPGVSGLEAQRLLLARGCNLPLVFVSGFGDASSASQALKAGAFDFLQKPIHGQQLVETLQAALSYHLVVLRREHRRQAAMVRLAMLTPREREVLRYLVDGWASKTIAAKLGRSKKTIDLHRANILRKVAVSSSAALVRLVLDSEDESLLHARSVDD
jgi:FixJ family two-component response regulator